jgi:hypothetical protein
LYRVHNKIVLPPPETKIWRYTDLSKLLDLVYRSPLRFTNVIELVANDKYEGYSVPQSVEEIAKTMKRKLPNSYSSEQELQQAAAIAHERIKAELPLLRRSFLVNCWHMNKHESAAMWGLYLSAHEGVAIQSTVGRLIEALKNATDDIFVGQMNYFDMDNEDRLYSCEIDLVMHKRKSFEHERELRAIRQLPVSPTSPHIPGTHVPVDVDTLIENVYVAPKSESWIKELIENVLEKYGLKRKVIHSVLDKDPVS